MCHSTVKPIPIIAHKYDYFALDTYTWQKLTLPTGKYLKLWARVGFSSQTVGDIHYIIGDPTNAVTVEDYAPLTDYVFDWSYDTPLMSYGGLSGDATIEFQVSNVSDINTYTAYMMWLITIE